MITLGTGVGGAILINGKPYQGAFNKAGHVGHIVINDDGDPDITGMPGSLEDAVGNATIAQRSKGKFTSTQAMLDAMHDGDAFAKQVWLTSVRKLAIGIASVTNLLSPETIILGGGITEAGKDLFEPLEEYLAKYEWRAGGNKVEITKGGIWRYVRRGWCSMLRKGIARSSEIGVWRQASCMHKLLLLRTLVLGNKYLSGLRLKYWNYFTSYW